MGRGNQSVLLVQDHPPTRARWKALLVGAGFDVWDASDLQSAIRQAGTSLPGVVVLDLLLPDGSGFDLCEQLLQLGGETGCTPSLVMTSSRAFPADRAQALEAGVSTFLEKPIRPHELVAAVRSALREATATAGVTEVLEVTQASEVSEVIEVGEIVEVDDATAAKPTLDPVALSA